MASVHEWMHRTSLIRAYLTRDKDSGIVRSNLSLTLDRSELAAVSYALGQAMTTIFCRSQLSVSHLLHIDRYVGTLGIRFDGSGRRADLVGSIGKEEWMVAEAKGRTGRVPRQLLRTMEEQKRSVLSIKKKRPVLAVGCVASFPGRDRALRVDAIDPDQDADDAVSLDISRDQYMLAYYAPFLRAFEFGTPREGDEYRSVDFIDLGIRMTMPWWLSERVRQAESGEVDGLGRDIADRLGEERRFEGSPDGTAFEALG